LFLSLQRVVCANNMTLFNSFCFAVFKQNDTFCDNSRVHGVSSLVLIVLFGSLWFPQTKRLPAFSAVSHFDQFP